MRDLIKKLLREQIFTKIRSNPNIYGCFLLKNQEKEFCKIASKKIERNKSKIKQQFKKILGLGLSDDLIKEKLLHYEMSKENPFFLQSRKDLWDLSKKLTGTCETAKASISDEIKNLNDKIVVLFKDKQNKNYHLINRLDTNYSALAYLLTMFRRHSSKKTSDLMLIDEVNYVIEVEKFYDLYFNISDVEMEKGKESDFFNQVFNYLGEDEKLEESLKLSFEDALYTIKKTREIGFKSEDEAINFLKTKYPNNEIVSYAGDFNFVDLLGVDAIMYSLRSETWIPVQIKSNISKCYGNKKFCKNMCVGKDIKSDTWIERYYNGSSEINIGSNI